MSGQCHHFVPPEKSSEIFELVHLEECLLNIVPRKLLLPDNRQVKNAKNRVGINPSIRRSNIMKETLRTS